MAIALNRRTLLVGAAALASAGTATSLGSRAAFAADERTNHALIVAVTAYPELPANAALIGPNNDAALVRDFLATNPHVDFAQDHIAVLADDLEGAASPTRAAIRGALDDLAGRVKPGDFVYLQFSGHGAQQPAMDPSLEPDGLDEIFLPRDTGMWTDRSKGVPNALIDKEIRDHLQAIRDKGAFIWAVFDCCHSGTMTRAAGLADTQEVERKISFTDLGISDKAMSEAFAASGAATRGTGGETERASALGLATAEPTGAAPVEAGGLVAFFAAQNTETTPEMPLPRGGENPVRLGLFTHTLVSKIAEMPSATYRQLGQAVLQAYAADNRTRPTPLFEGDLDRPIFGMGEGERIAQWPIRMNGDKIEVPAGTLHRLSKGARLAVLPSPGAATEDAIGYVEVLSAKSLTSMVAPIAFEQIPARAAGEFPAGAYARLTDIALGFELVVSRPGDGGASPEDVARLNAALDRVAQDKSAPVNVRLVGPTEAADLKLALMSEMDVGVLVGDQLGATATDRASMSTQPRLWLLSPSAQLSLEPHLRPVSMPVEGLDDDQLAGEISDNLVRIFRANSLARLASASDFRPDEVTVDFKILRDASGEIERLAGGKVPVVHPDDQVHIEARNDSTKPVDINVLYIGSDYSIGHMYAERLSAGSRIDLPLLAFTDTSFGMERMVVVLSEVLPQTPLEDLAFLEQIGVRDLDLVQDDPFATRSVGGGAPGMGDMLRQLAKAPATRAAARLSGKSGAKGAVMIFPMETTPRG